MALLLQEFHKRKRLFTPRYLTWIFRNLFIEYLEYLQS